MIISKVVDQVALRAIIQLFHFVFHAVRLVFSIVSEIVDLFYPRRFIRVISRAPTHGAAPYYSLREDTTEQHLKLYLSFQLFQGGLEVMFSSA